MLQTAEEIIKYIGDAKKQTPIKMYLKGENLPDTDAFHLFGDSHFKIAIGDLDAINAYVEENKDLIKDSFIEQDRRNSAIPMLDMRISTHVLNQDVSFVKMFLLEIMPLS